MNALDIKKWPELDRSIYLRLAEGYINSKFPVGSDTREYIESICSIDGPHLVSSLIDYPRKEEKPQENNPSLLVVGDSQFLSGILAVKRLLSETEHTIRGIIVYGDKYNGKINPHMIEEARRVNPEIEDMQQSHVVLIRHCLDEVGLNSVPVSAIDYLPADTIENTGVISKIRTSKPDITHFHILTKSFHAYRQWLMLRQRYPELGFKMVSYEVPGVDLGNTPFEQLEREVQLLLAGEYDGTKALEEYRYK